MVPSVLKMYFSLKTHQELLNFFSPYLDILIKINEMIREIDFSFSPNIKWVFLLEGYLEQ